MENPVLYLPIATTVLSAVFAWVVFQRFRRQARAWHLGWWAAGIFLFGLGTFTEGYTAVFGWNEAIFRSWYISGALLGGAPLAQGTVYLLLSRRVAHGLSLLLVPYIAVAAVFVLLTPVDAAIAEEHRLSPNVIEWTWVRAFSPLINTYAFIFLVGGAILSAMRYRDAGGHRGRVTGNILIAVGAILPGIGGAFTRAGYTEVLYVTEFIGIILLYFGYRLNVAERPGGEEAETGRSASLASA
jgi:hypothetical protein